MLAHLLAGLVCVCAFVIYSLNVHFICLEIKNNLIIYRINIHIEWHCAVAAAMVVLVRTEGMHSRSRAHKYCAVSFSFVGSTQLLFIVWCCRHCWHERVQIAICFVCLSASLVPVRSSHQLHERAIVFVVKVIHALSICRQCPVHGIEYQ